MHSDKEPHRLAGDLTTEDPARSDPSRPARTTGEPQSDPALPARTAGAAERADTAGSSKDPGRRDDAETAPDALEGAGVAGAPTGRAGTAGATAATGIAGTAHTADAKPAEDADDEVPRLLEAGDERDFRDRWRETQSKFVDDPREAVHSADTLVADVIRTLTTTFAQHKQELEGQWSQGERADTEELRRALRRYRSFFNRLLGD
ncbi:hypothetical protein [Streptomyces sennicomposti]